MRLRAAEPPAKGEPPARVPPLTPSCASLAQGAFRALRRAARGSAPGPRPLFCKKAGQKTFKRQSTSSPSPSPWRRVIQSVREADTLAAEWQLPREWERRVGPETSRGRHHPISVFLWGSTPFLWARPKKWGGTGSTNVKTTANKTASSSNPPGLAREKGGGSVCSRLAAFILWFRLRARSRARSRASAPRPLWPGDSPARRRCS